MPIFIGCARKLSEESSLSGNACYSILICRVLHNIGQWESFRTYTTTLKRERCGWLRNIVIGCAATPPKREWRRVAQVYLWSYGETTYQIHSPVRRNGQLRWRHDLAKRHQIGVNPNSPTPNCAISTALKANSIGLPSPLPIYFCNRHVLTQIRGDFATCIPSFHCLPFTQTVNESLLLEYFTCDVFT